MKRLLLIPLLAFGLAFGGCTFNDGTRAVGDFVRAATSTFTNPVSATNLYQAKLTFAASQELVEKYQRDCFGSQLPPYPVSFAKIKADPVLSVECKHRVSRYNTMKLAEDRADRAIVLANKFIRENPSGNAVSYITNAIKAVTDYQAKAGG